MCPLPYVLTHAIPHALPVTVNLQAVRVGRSGSLVGISKHPRTPVSNSGRSGTLEGPCTAVLHGRRETAGPERMVCAGWGRVPHFSCMSPDSQLHILVPRQPFSPGCLQLPGRCWVCPKKAGGHWGWGPLQAILPGVCAEAFLSRLVSVHIYTGTRCPGKPAPSSGVSRGCVVPVLQPC